jgi:rod shape-determining protein MreB
MKILDWFRRDIAIDLGTANTLIIQNGDVLLDEPSIIAIEKSTNRIIAVGAEAQQMHEKTHDDIKTIRPLKDGVIADFHAAEHMIRGMIKMIANKKKYLFPPMVHKMVICIPSGITDVEKRAVRDSAEHAGAKEVYMITEPIAAAIGIGVDIKAPNGTMIVDIGGGTTEIAVIALSGIVCDRSIKIAGDMFNNDILEHIRKNHNLLIGERTAEKAKITIGAASCDLENPPMEMSIPGRDLITGKPKVISLSFKEIAKALDASIIKIENAIMQALEASPPELSADIYENGIFLTGGGALLRGLATRIAKKTDLSVHVAEDPLRAVVRGTGIVLNNIKSYRSVLMT